MTKNLSIGKRSNPKVPSKQNSLLRLEMLLLLNISKSDNVFDSNIANPSELSNKSFITIERNFERNF